MASIILSQPLRINDLSIKSSDTLAVKMSFSDTIKIGDVISLSIKANKSIIKFLPLKISQARIDFYNEVISGSEIVTQIKYVAESEIPSSTEIEIPALPLWGSPTSTTYQVVDFSINFKEQFQSNIATIETLLNSFQRNDLRIENFYPNPFSREGFTPFTLDRDAEIGIKIYSLSGKLMLKLPEYSLINYKLFEQDKVTEVKSLNLKKGTYYFYIFPDEKINSGAYTLYLTIGEEEKSINFIIAK
jgi:hypothetical protein